MPQLHAVARGDIVGSSELPPEVRRDLPRALRTAYATAQNTAPDALPHDVAVVGGDGWQCYVSDPTQALARVLHFWTLLHANGLSSRVALAIDTIDFIAEGNVNESDGAAFRRSGRALEALPDDRWAACVLPDAAPETFAIGVASMFELVDQLMHGWTEAQARAVAGMLAGVGTDISVTQTSIAEAWDPEPITRQSVNRHLHRAHWSRLERTTSRYETLVRMLAEEI